MDDTLNQHLHSFSGRWSATVRRESARKAAVFCGAAEVFLADGLPLRKLSDAKTRLATRSCPHIRTPQMGIGKELSVNNYGRNCFSILID